MVISAGVDPVDSSSSCSLSESLDARVALVFARVLDVAMSSSSSISRGYSSGL